MSEEEAQAKQLDSVTDRVEEQEVDSAKAQQAMSALSPSPTKSGGAAGGRNGEGRADEVVVNKEDVELICKELEITEDMAMATLREVAVQEGGKPGDSMVAAALRKLVTS